MNTLIVILIANIFYNWDDRADPRTHSRYIIIRLTGFRDFYHYKRYIGE